MTLVSRYIAKRVFKSITLAFVIVTAIIMLIDFVEATRNIGDDGAFTLLELAGLTALKVPRLIEETIPFVVLFGIMSAFYGLNKRSELVVLRASGLSAWRFLWPAVMVSALIGLIWATVFNPFAAKSMTKYQDILIEAAQNEKISSSSRQITEDIWLREGTQDEQVVIHGTVRPYDPLTLHDATFYFYTVNTAATGDSLSPFEISEDTSYSHRIDVKSAALSPEGYWQLRGVTKNLGHNRTTRFLTTSLPTRITATQLTQKSKFAGNTQFWTLPSEIMAARDAGFSTVSLRLQWHKLLSLPLMLIALTVIAAGVSMGNVRSGGVLRLMLAGAATGFFVYFFNNLIRAFGESQTLSIFSASWTVPLLVLLMGIAYLARLEDG